MMENLKKIYLVGIGGISMSGLAKILHSRGVSVSGSDMNFGPVIKELMELGIEVFIGHSPENVPADAELLVYTAAVKEDNPELVRAGELGIKIMPRSEFLGWIMEEYPYSAAVSGTHGKTTTSSMLAQILITAGMDPTVSVGGVLPFMGGSVQCGKSPYFVAEACEYYDGFLQMNPYVAIILNAEKEHTDYFKDTRQVLRSFRSFVRRVDPEGYLVLNRDMEHSLYLADAAKCHVVTFGEPAFGNPPDHWHPENITEERAAFSFDPFFNGYTPGRVNLKIMGRHNIMNALAAAAAAHCFGVPGEDIVKGLSEFTGVRRRMELKGSYNGADIYDDYAHHPTEISVVLDTLRRITAGRLICVFQPHTYSRTLALFPAFVKALQKADTVLLPPIYAARETDDGLVSSRDLAEGIRLMGKPSLYFSNYYEINKYLLNYLAPGDLVVTMGAGDVYLAAEGLF